MISASDVPVLTIVQPCDDLGIHRWTANMIAALVEVITTSGAIPSILLSEQIDESRLDDICNHSDGFVMVSGALRRDWVWSLANRKPPIMCVGSKPRQLDLPHVDLDGADASAQLVHHLHREGRHRIGLISGPMHRDDMRRRMHGFRDAVADVQLLHDDRLTFDGDLSRESGYRGADRLLAAGADAIVTMTSSMAHGVLDRLEDGGVAVPDEISVAAIDTHEVNQLMGLTITAIEQPYRVIAETAVLELRTIIAGRAPTPQTLIRGELIVGTTTRSSSTSAERR